MANEQDRDRQPEEPDAGSYIGHEPERATETIPGGIQPEDERVAAHSTRPDGGEAPEAGPSGHRQGDRATDDDIREAGQGG
jgi:hypothetical protein